MHVLVPKKLMFLIFWMTNYNSLALLLKAMFETCMRRWIVPFFMHPLVFVSLGTYLSWMAAIHFFFPALFVVGFIAGPCQDVGIAPRHQWAYFCTAVVGGILFLISKIRPPFFTTPWFTIPFFFLMGLYLSCMLSNSEERREED